MLFYTIQLIRSHITFHFVCIKAIAAEEEDDEDDEDYEDDEDEEYEDEDEEEEEVGEEEEEVGITFQEALTPFLGDIDLIHICKDGKYTGKIKFFIFKIGRLVFKVPNNPAWIWVHNTALFFFAIELMM